MQILSPCPHCHSRKVEWAQNVLPRQVFYVRCKACFMCGPEKKNRDAAFEAWNGLPRKEQATKRETDLSAGRGNASLDY